MIKGYKRKHELMVPTVHMNGTAGVDLQDEVLKARAAVQTAIDALCDMTVHGRDYYPQGPAAIVHAMEQQSSRMQALRLIKEELEAMWEGLEAQQCR